MCWYLEVIRMHQQLGTRIGEQGALAAGRELLHKKTMAGMFRGTMIGWMKTFPEFLVKNMVLEQLKHMKMINVDASMTTSSLLLRVLASTLCVRLVTYPFEICKLRVMQFEGAKPYTGLFETARRVVMQEGFFGLFKGLSMGLVASFTYSVTMSIVSPWTHALALSLGLPIEVSQHVSRLASMFTSYPFETLKRRMASEADWIAHDARSVLPCANLSSLQLCRSIIRNSSWTDFFAGFPLQAAITLVKPLIVQASNASCNRIFLWNNGFTVSIFDATPLAGIPQHVSPDELLRLKRRDNRV